MSRFSTFLPLHVRFVLALSRVKLLYPLLVCCLIGASVYVGGIFVEASELHTIPRAAITNAYGSAPGTATFEYSSLFDYVGKAMSGELPRESENMQVTAMAISYAGSLLLTLVVLTARAAWIMQVRMSPVAGGKKK